MSERRRKRAGKKSSTGVRKVQTREGAPHVPQINQPVPKQEGEGMAETDTKNTNIEGGNKVNGTFMDRIREHKTLLIQVGVVIAIAVLVSAIMIMQLAATNGDIAAEATRVDTEFAGVTTHINTLGTSLNNRMDDVEAIAETAGAGATENSNDIDALQTWADEADARIATAEAQNSPPEGYLTGNFSSNYTLHAICDTAGNYTANINLVYLTPVAVGNTTQEDALQAFYGSINWTGKVPSYICTTTYSGNTTTWGISKVSWNIGTFPMAANNETLVDIIPAGLNSTYTPDFAYAELWPVLK
jgi:hypothetical protein